jgi:hypothetical protein
VARLLQVLRALPVRPMRLHHSVPTHTSRHPHDLAALAVRTGAAVFENEPHGRAVGSLKGRVSGDVGDRASGSWTPGRHRATTASEIDYSVAFERDTQSASSVCTVGSRSPSELAVSPKVVRSNREDMKLALGGSAAW